MERARKADVPVKYVEGVVGKKYPDKESRSRARQAFDAEVLQILKQYDITVIALAGFNQIVTPVIIDEYRMRIMNIHPAYNVKRYGGVGMVGDHVHESVLANHEKYSGCTVHYVEDAVDLGPAILRQLVPVKPDDTVRSLADRILVWEHRSYSKGIQIHVDGQFELRRHLSEQDLQNDEWENRWNQRQQQYLEYQQKHATELYGKPLEEIL
jgi:phosphoribosylglycinamide formyltransferase-1